MKVEKFNEFVNGDFSFIQLIEEVEKTNVSDPQKISEGESYRKIVSIGEKVVPFLIERKKYIWNIALKDITGVEPVGNSSSEILEFWKNWMKENEYKK
jgi:hypothetical protein